MPLGGITPGWDESVPADSENAGLGAQRIRSLETALQQILDSEHNFPASGGANTGYHRLGSARAFFGAESTVSSSGTDGRLMVTSDTSRLFHVGSAGTMLLGGQTSALLNFVGNNINLQQSYWAIEVGTAGQPNSSGSATATFSSAFSGQPLVFGIVVKNKPSEHPYTWLVQQPTATSAVFGLWDQAANSALTLNSVYYISIGTRAL